MPSPRWVQNRDPPVRRVATRASRECNALILAFHGCSCLGDTIAMAFRRALNLEQAAMTTYRSLLLGNADLTFPPERLDELATV